MQSQGLAPPAMQTPQAPTPALPAGQTYYSSVPLPTTVQSFTMAATPASGGGMTYAGVGAGAGTVYHDTPMVPRSPAESIKPAKPAQTRKTPEQVKALEELFFGAARKFDPAVRATSELILQAQRITGLTRKQVRQWFQYKRQKAKATHGKSPKRSESNDSSSNRAKGKVVPFTCGKHNKMMVLYDCKGTSGAALYKCKGVADEDGDLHTCLWSKARPVNANAALAAVLRQPQNATDASTPSCQFCTNPVVLTTTDAVGSHWPDVNLEPLRHALLHVCSKGHIYGEVVLPKSGLDASLERGYLPK